MTARTVRWDTGEVIPGTGFRHLVTSAETDGRFSAQSAVLDPGRLVLPHSHELEDEISFVFRGRIGGRVGDEDVVVDEGGFLFKPRGVVHALWNASDVPAVVVELITPGGFEGFFEEMGALGSRATPEIMREIAGRYGQTPHPELVAELSERYGVRP